MTKFIILSGKKGHGKNYFAKVVADYLKPKLSVKEVAFADPIKSFCNDVFGIPYEDMMTLEGKLKLTHIKWSDIYCDIAYDNWCNGNKNAGADFANSTDWTASDKYLTVREVLQIIGTDVWRERFYRQIWAEAPFRKQHKEDIVIITDCRFPNELQCGHQFGAVPVRIVKPGVISNDPHPSETSLDNYSWGDNEVFINDADGPDKIVLYTATTLLPKLGL